MMNFSQVRCKTDGELPLSKRLAQELITSPMLGRGRQQAMKSKIVEKNPDVNFLFDDEKPKLKTRRTEKLREVINMSYDIRKQVAQINERKLGSQKIKKIKPERVHKGSKKPQNTPFSYFVEVGPDNFGRAKSPTASETLTLVSRLSDDDNVDKISSKEDFTPPSSKKTFRIKSAEKIQGELTSPTSKQRLRKMSSEARLKWSELEELGKKEKSPTESVVTNIKDFGSSLARALGKIATLKRQTSLLDLNLIGDGPGHLSTVLSLFESDENIPEETKRRTSCLFPGWEPGEDCHSVSASIFGVGLREPCLSSSSSFDDIYESTKYSRDIIEEKLRGLELEKKQEEAKSKEVKVDERMKKRKFKASSKCKCHRKKEYHSKCGSPPHTKIDKKFSTTSSTSGVEQHSGSDKQVIRTKADYGTVTDNESLKSEISKVKSVVESAVKDEESGESTSSRAFVKHPCVLDTCPSLRKNIPEDYVAKREKPLALGSHDVKKCDQSRDDVKMEKAGSDMGEHISTGLRSRAPVEVGSSAPSETTIVDSCASETCQYKKILREHSKSELHRHQISRSEHSHGSSKKKEICAPKICKTSKRHSKRRFRFKNRKLKHRKEHRRWKSKQHHFKCECHTLYVDDGDSDTEDLWSDKNFKRSRKRRYNLMFEHVKKRAANKCGGYVTEGHNCNCYVCYIKEKPWKKFLKKPNTVLDIPYLLTTNSLKARAQNTNALLKKLKNKYNWSEENLKNYCTRHEICKKPTLRKSLLQENPFLWEWKWCHPDKHAKKVKKEAPKGMKSGRFGYYVNIKEERLTRGEHFTNIQKIIEKAVHCKWNQDVAEMKLNHFLENMPKQQTCYAEGKMFDPDRRTCYNPKLIQRLSEIVKFNDDADRGIHEFSFPPKLLKYQEPQLVADIGMDMPEIRPVMELAKSPTIYRDLFRDTKHDLRKLMDTLLPPLQWTDTAGLWEMKVSIEPDNDETNKDLIRYLDHNETLCHAINKNFCAGRYRLYFEVFAEVIRQEVIDNPERAFLLARIREEFLLTMLLYDGGLEMTLVATTHLWKDIEADIIPTHEKEILEKEIEELQEQIKTIMVASYDLERFAEEQSQTRDYQNKDQEKLIKKTNHQLVAQYESIKAGLLYDID